MATQEVQVGGRELPRRLNFLKWKVTTDMEVHDPSLHPKQCFITESFIFRGHPGLHHTDAVYDTPHFVICAHVGLYYKVACSNLQPKIAYRIIHI